MKESKKLEAIKLRRRKKSYREIAETLDVSKSTVSYWFKDINWSQKIKCQLSLRARAISRKKLEHLNNLKKIKWDRIYKNAEDEAKRDFVKLQNNRLFLLGIAIYWGEGDKKFSNGRVRVGNIDSELLRLFKIFLIEICKIKQNKLKVNVLFYPDLNPDDCIQYWSKKIGIRRNNFYNPVLIKGKHKTKRIGNGVCIIQLCDKYIKKKILVWIDLLSKTF